MYALLIATLLSLAQPPAAEVGARGAEVGVILRVHGRVQVLRGGAAICRAGDCERQPLRLRDDLQTDPGAALELKLDDDGKLVLGPDSHLVLDPSPAAGVVSQVNLRHGDLLLIHHEKGGGDRVEVATPNAQITLQGTILVIRYWQSAAGEKTVVEVLEGEATVASRATGSRRVARGFRALVPAGRPPTLSASGITALPAEGGLLASPSERFIDSPFLDEVDLRGFFEGLPP